MDIATLDKLIEFCSLPKGLTLKESGITKFHDSCTVLINRCENMFPAECGQLCLLLQMREENIIDIRQAIDITRQILIHMRSEWDKQVKPKKIFISHSTNDKEFVDKLVVLLERMGVKQPQLFCSSISGYGIPQGSGDLYNYIRNQMSNDNLFVIIMLSENYYNSPVCLNEMGAAWIKQSAYQGILLPGFDYPDIKGAINPRDICFQLSDKENRKAAMNEFKNRIISHLEMEEIDQTRWERFRDTFFDEIDRIPVSLKTNERSQLTLSKISFSDMTDDEKIVLYYAASKKVRNLRKLDVSMWIEECELDDINVESVFDLLSTYGSNTFKDEVLTLDAELFRGLVNKTLDIEDFEAIFEDRQNFRDKQFLRLWHTDEFDDMLKLFVAYIVDERVSSLGNRWQARNQVEYISEWENKLSLDDTLSKNYDTCLNFFIQNGLVYECDWTSYGNPKEYRLYSSVIKLLFTTFKDKIELIQVKKEHIMELPF